MRLDMAPCLINLADGFVAPLPDFDTYQWLDRPAIISLDNNSLAVHPMTGQRLVTLQFFPKRPGWVKGTTEEDLMASAMSELSLRLTKQVVADHDLKSNADAVLSAGRKRRAQVMREAAVPTKPDWYRAAGASTAARTAACEKESRRRSDAAEGPKADDLGFWDNFAYIRLTGWCGTELERLIAEAIGMPVFCDEPRLKRIDDATPALDAIDRFARTVAVLNWLKAAGKLPALGNGVVPAFISVPPIMATEDAVPVP
jgi:hypothetical protein